MRTINLLVFLLVFNTFIMLGFIASQFTGNAIVQERISVNLTRIIDGDTFQDANNQSYRLLGINTPEKKQPFYREALDFLKQYESQIVELELHGKDKYNRELVYFFYKNQLVNSDILAQGLANLYVYEKDGYYSELLDAESYARKNNLGLWKKSDNYGCIELIKLQYNEQPTRCSNNEQLILKNNCQAINATLKDSANHIYNINLTNGIFTKNFSCIWNDDGDSLTLRDESGLLVYYRY